MCRCHVPPEPGDGSTCLFASAAARTIHLRVCLVNAQLPNTAPSHREPKGHQFPSLSKHVALPLLLASYGEWSSCLQVEAVYNILGNENGGWGMLDRLTEMR